MVSCAVAGISVGRAVVNRCPAAFGVFHGFQITNLDGFFRCHIVFFRSCSSFSCGCFCQPQWTAKETALIRTVRLSFAFLLFVVGLVMALSEGRAMMLLLLAGHSAAAAFSVFFGLQVTNFYVFLGCHNFSF